MFCNYQHNVVTELPLEEGLLLTQKYIEEWKGG